MDTIARRPPDPDRASRALRCDESLRGITTPKFYVFLGIAVFGIWTAESFQSGRFSALPKPDADELDYDCIAVQLWKQNGFAYGYQDADYLAPYAAQNDSAEYERFVASIAGRCDGPTTYRPPLLPAVMAASYAVFGRQFVVARVLNTACAAATVALAAWLCRAFVGPMASFFAVGLIMWLGRVQYHASLLMTESASALFVGICVALMAVRLAGRPRSTALLVGGLWGVAVLTRTSFVIWLPPLLGGICVIAAGAPQGDDRPSRGRAGRGAGAAGCFLAGMLVVVAPWWFRNCLVLDAPMPLGAQGLIELPTGFSDAAVEHQGVWFPLSGIRFYESRLPRSETPLTAAQFERRTAECGRESVIAWVRANPSKLPALTIKKIKNEWKPSTTIDACVLFTALLGGAFFRGSPFGRACLAMFLGDLVMIGATWSVEGRFTFPLAVPLYALAGAATWLLLRLVTDLRTGIRLRST